MSLYVFLSMDITYRVTNQQIKQPKSSSLLPTAFKRSPILLLTRFIAT